MYEDFYNHIFNIVSKFKELDKDLPIRIISHLDADGITSASILIKAFSRENRKFSLTVVKQITQSKLKEIAREDYKILFFTDLGSNNLTDIENLFKNKEIFILDHHIPEKTDTKLNFINPHMFNIDGNHEISGAGVSYLFSRELNEENKDLSYLAIIGAFGDVQYDEKKLEFFGVNKEILEDSLLSKKLKIERGLKIFGSQTRPIHKFLEYSTDPFIPNITGDSDSAIMFLNELKIPVKDENGNWRKVCDLSEIEMKNLVTGIILRRMGSEKDPEDILGNLYILTGEDERSLTRNAKEFATLLNACGKMNKSSIAVGICLGDHKSRDMAEEVLFEYKKEIINALNWFYSNRKKGLIKEYKNLVIINAENQLRDTIIGTMASIISKSNLYEDGTVIVSMVYTSDNEIKVSTRSVNSDINLKQVLETVCGKLDVQLGGHKSAAGCLFSIDKEKEFIELMEKIILKK